MKKCLFLSEYREMIVVLAGCGLMNTAVAATGPQPPDVVPSAKVLNRAFGMKDVENFQNPPQVFHPETWFHFIGGNVATQGITADLETIAKVGISGIQLFHGQFGGPWPGVEPQIKCLSELWDGEVQHVANECRRLGLRFTMQNCPGWAMSGGPWIAPSNAMRHLVWSRTDIAGGSDVRMVLPLPQPSKEEWRDYRDVAVLAFPTPDGDTGKALVPVSVRSNREDLPWAKCLRSEKNGKIQLQPGQEPVWVEATFPEVVTLRTVRLPPVQGFNHGWCYNPGVTIIVQAVLPEGGREVARYEMPQSNWQDNKPISLACSEVPTKTYRIIIDHKHSLTLPYIQLFSGAQKNNWEAEAAWVLRGLIRTAHPQQTKTAWIDLARVLDVTGKMDAQGTLHWEAPAGNWTVMRWGHVNTGRRNGPAPAEATGWECDKLSPTGAEAQFAGYIGRLSNRKGPVGGGLLQGLLFDSWECETQTWTPDMDRQFQRLRGYALRPWLPALAGYVIGDPETTTKFLRDWRSAVNDLLVANFFGRMAQLGHGNGLSISFETASGDVFPGDILEYYKYADMPMCEFWQPRSESFVGSLDFKPIKPCASAAHLYGKPRIAAEAFTSTDLRWDEHPGMLKDIANAHFAEGVTHLVFHTYTHNPRTDFLPPGTSFGAGIGTPFLRGQTWWRYMPEFVNYLARCNYLLERGRPQADVLWYLGDEQDHKPSQEAPFPEGYRFDYCNPDILLNRLTVRDGQLVTPEGLHYRVLWLRECPRMLPETLERMLALVKKGAVLVGERPQGLATLSGGAWAEERFRMAAEALWGKAGITSDGGSTNGVRQVGRGRVLSGVTLEAALRQLGIEPDVAGQGVVWTHRQVDGADWYFVAAPARQGFRGTLKFRARGTVEIWDPVTGAVTPAGVVRCEKDTSLVALDIPPSGSAFVVFKSSEKAGGAHVVRVEYDGVPVVDAQGIHPSPDGQQVLSASYGDPADSARRKDVTELVRRNLAHGATAISVNTGLVGEDPAPKTRKQLAVVMRLPSGQEKQLQAWEGESLKLVEPVATPLPACEILDNGRTLLAWETGAYRITQSDGTVKTVKAHAPRRVPLSGIWTLSFPKGWGAPDKVRLDGLKPWTELELPAEGRAFSGTATYTTEFSIQSVASNTCFELDLGRVAVIANVRVNDIPVGTVWSPPYRLDVTPAVKPGLNTLSVEVTSTWFNRLAYDAGLPEAERKTWTIKGPAKDVALRLSGLLGPVTLYLGQRLSE